MSVTPLCDAASKRPPYRRARPFRRHGLQTSRPCLFLCPCPCPPPRPPPSWPLPPPGLCHQRGGDTSDTLYRIVSLYRVYRCISLYRRTYRRLASRRPVRIRGQIYIEYRMYHTLMYRDTALYTTDTSQRTIHQRRYITNCYAHCAAARATARMSLRSAREFDSAALRAWSAAAAAAASNAPPAVPFTRRDSQRWDGALLLAAALCPLRPHPCPRPRPRPRPTGSVARSSSSELSSGAPPPAAPSMSSNLRS